MKSMLRILLVPFVTLAFAGLVSAQGTTSGTAPSKSSTSSATKSTTEKKAAAPKTLRERGELTAVDAKAGTAKVKLKDKELSLNADGQEAKDSLAKVKVGDHVRVAYVESDGKLMLKSISKTKLPGATKSSSSSTASATKSSTASDTKPAK